MQPLTALIVDDEQLARENLRMLLDEFCPEINVIDTATGVEDARAKIEELRPQVVFLDIRMPSGAEGFDLLQSLDKQEFMVVFVTAFKDYAVKAFNANAIHYVLKPIDIDDLRNAVSKLLETKKRIESSPNGYSDYVQTLEEITRSINEQQPAAKITISHTKGFKVIDEDKIISINAEGNCSNLHFTDGTAYLDTRPLKTYEELLSPAKFFRVHKSHIINLDQVTEYLHEDGHQVILKNGKRVPVARLRLRKFINRLRQN